jgi:pantetheine-phosphate adenylyltransferase
MVYPGSFDPFTLGHLNVVSRAARLADQVRIVIFLHPDKPGWLAPDRRAALITETVRETLPGADVRVDISHDLLVRYLEQHQCQIVVRGIRSQADWVYEESMAAMNRELLPGLETVYLASPPALAHVSSSRVRELWRYGAGVTSLVPAAVARGLPPPPGEAPAPARGGIADGTA